MEGQAEIPPAWNCDPFISQSDVSIDKKWLLYIFRVRREVHDIVNNMPEKSKLIIQASSFFIAEGQSYEAHV